MRIKSSRTEFNTTKVLPPPHLIVLTFQGTIASTHFLIILTSSPLSLLTLVYDAVGASLLAGGRLEEGIVIRWAPLFCIIGPPPTPIPPPMGMLIPMDTAGEFPLLTESSPTSVRRLMSTLMCFIVLCCTLSDIVSNSCANLQSESLNLAISASVHLLSSLSPVSPGFALPCNARVRSPNRWKAWPAVRNTSATCMTLFLASVLLVEVDVEGREDGPPNPTPLLVDGPAEGTIPLR
ncbi:hypothetical protein PMAYCL1PPCAC_02849, partial [Pristionchus mayeri]